MDVLSTDASWNLLSSITLGRLVACVKGTAQVLNTSAEVEEAQRAQLLRWTAGLKPRYVRVYPSEISGRRFRFGSESERR